MGDRIRERRLALGLSQAELGARIATESSMVSRWETNRVNVSQRYILKLAQALRTSSDYLLGKTDDAAPTAADQPVSTKVLLSSEPPATSGRLIYEHGDHRLDLPDTPEDRELFARLVEKIISSGA